ncbi:MAG: hypothetical protein JSU82_10200 [Rhodospirillales bacterium]|nr:MAG: hypothetical protein JSU82_10200 [Rhodospirillales bacterium]
MSHFQRIAMLILVTAAVVAAVYLMLPPIPQDPAYHEFADTRSLLGIPRVGDVLSNAAFTAAGLAGLGALFLGWFGVPPADARERLPYAVFFLGVALVGPASAYYHWDPGNETLFWDRVFLTVAFMGLVAAILADRVHRGRASGWLCALLVAAGFASVLSWSVGEAAGAGDLRAYLLVQFYPLAAVPLVLWLFPDAMRVESRFIGWAIAIYAVAKLAELYDPELFGLFGGSISGHTIKHLVAALAPVAIIAMMRSWPRSIAYRYTAEGCTALRSGG